MITRRTFWKAAGAAATACVAFPLSTISILWAKRARVPYAGGFVDGQRLACHIVYLHENGTSRTATLPVVWNTYEPQA